MMWERNFNDLINKVSKTTVVLLVGIFVFWSYFFVAPQQVVASEVQKSIELTDSLKAQLVELLKERIREILAERIVAANAVNNSSSESELTPTVDKDSLLEDGDEIIYYTLVDKLHAEYKNGDTKEDRSDKFNLEAEEIPELYKDLWQRFYNMDGVAGTVDFVRFYNDSDKEESSLGFGGGGLYVWLSINIAGYIPGDIESEKKMTHTLVNEMGRMLTLSALELDLGTTQAKCKTVYIPSIRACSKEESYLTQYSEIFWSDEDLLDGIGDIRRSVGDRKDELRDSFYEENQETFFNLDSSDDIGEDLAEAFTHFALSARPENLEKVTDRKIEFFYQFSKMVKIKDKINDQL